jgi:hypothetical protein
VERLEKYQEIFESLRRENHRQGNHDGQAAMEFALEQIRLVQSETKLDEGYPGIAHDFETMRTALHDLEQAALRMAQCWNKADERGEGVTVAEVNAARQGVDEARKKARAALRVKGVR